MFKNLDQFFSIVCNLNFIRKFSNMMIKKLYPKELQVQLLWCWMKLIELIIICWTVFFFFIFFFLIIVKDWDWAHKQIQTDYVVLFLLKILSIRRIYRKLFAKLFRNTNNFSIKNFILKHKKISKMEYRKIGSSCNSFDAQ